MEQSRKEELRKIITNSVREQIKEIESYGSEGDMKFGDYNANEAKGWLMDGVIDVVETECKLSESDGDFYPACDLYEEVVTEIVKEYYPEADFE
ncbi:hypothetical protein SAMN04487977_101545 [Treponema bryantii]|uniref:Uncharacterized protein n=1 Tax=Treponema bryantii TaxID=163 RepID=A0A1H9B2G0_9SPIR|nr:hypothetical protein [Treponema bryantii]SEP82843.1 hypothetical protein SAMN04487977_101545 [Treponema bryantii]